MSKNRSLLMPLQELKDRGALPGDPCGPVIAGCPGHPGCPRVPGRAQGTKQGAGGLCSLAGAALQLCSSAPTPLGWTTLPRRQIAHILPSSVPLTPSASPVRSASPQRETARAVHLPQQLTNIAFTIIIAITVI